GEVEQGACGRVPDEELAGDSGTTDRKQEREASLRRVSTRGPLPRRSPVWPGGRDDRRVVLGEEGAGRSCGIDRQSGGVSDRSGDGPAAVIVDHGEIMRRFSIRTGMASVFLIAVGLSIIRRRDDRLLPMVLGGVLVGILMGCLLMAAVLALIDRFGRRPDERGD